MVNIPVETFISRKSGTSYTSFIQLIVEYAAVGICPIQRLTMALVDLGTRLLV